jgi:DNA-binding NtrC family response regulator
MPSLRERDNDVTLLINHFLRRHAERHETKVRRFSQEAMRLLVDYSWPGNVRELENTVEYALTLGTEEELGTDDLPTDVLKGGEAGPDGRPRISGDLALSEVERRHITATLARFGGHYIKTASALGIDRRTLYRKLKQYDLNASREDASTMVE